ncbi:hypothetical protein [Actinomadura geliboluensis]
MTAVWAWTAIMAAAPLTVLALAFAIFRRNDRKQTHPHARADTETNRG